jgi:hypothetical protein
VRFHRFSLTFYLYLIPVAIDDVKRLLDHSQSEISNATISVTDIDSSKLFLKRK